MNNYLLRAVNELVNSQGPFDLTSSLPTYYVLTVPQSVRHYWAVNLETYPRIAQITVLLHPKRVSPRAQTRWDI